MSAPLGSRLEPLRLTPCSPEKPQRVINGLDSSLLGAIIFLMYFCDAPLPPARHFPFVLAAFGDLSECQALSWSEHVPRVSGPWALPSWL